MSNFRASSLITLTHNSLDYNPCGYHEWIGPRVFDVWGLPKKKALKTCTKAESEQIASIAEEIYNKVRR